MWMSSFSSRIPLTTPSGPQWTESELEAELVEQIAFSPGVYDIITQPILLYPGSDGKERRYTPDIAVQLYASGDGARPSALASQRAPAQWPRTTTDKLVSRIFDGF